MCEEHSHAESPAGQHQSHPQDELSAAAAAAASPNTSHHILSQYHLLLNRLRRTYRFKTVLFRTDKPLFFCYDDILSVRSLAQTKRLVAAVDEAA